MNEGATEASGERAVAAGRDIGNAAAGDFVTQIARATVLPAEAFSLDPCTARICHLPYRTGQFVGRERELRLLDEAFGETGGVVVHAVHGLGGIGKSTLAAHWAAAHAAEFNPVWWITAESPAELDAGLAALGRALWPALVGVLTEEALRERTIQWLASNDGWLVVLDNVSDPADIRPLLDRVPGGRLLVTTRRGPTSWRGIARTLDLDVLAPAEAVELFGGIYDGPAEGVEELCAELGCLPLAIDQAAAYCREAGVTPQAYLDLLARYPADMYAATAEGGGAERTVERVWQVTLDALTDTPAAVVILCITAWWAPDDIPRAYLEEIGSPVEVTEAVRRLAAHSMVKVRGDMLSVHRLVQAVARAGDAETAATFRNVASNVLMRRLPRTPHFGDPERLWATHVEALASCVHEGAETQTLALLLATAAGRLGRAQRQRGATLFERARSVAERNPDWRVAPHIAVLAAPFYVFIGDFGRALPLLKRQVEELAGELGSLHPKTLESRVLLAMALWEVDPERAKAVAQETAEGAASELGTDHPVTFRARRVLQRIVRENGGPHLLEDQIAEAARLLGEGDHFVTVLKQRLLGELERSGDLDKALVLAEEVVARYRRHVGDSDHDTLSVRAQQIQLLMRAGEEAQAARLLPGLLADRKRLEE